MGGRGGNYLATTISSEIESDTISLLGGILYSLVFLLKGLYGQIPKPPPVPGPSQICVFMYFEKGFIAFRGAFVFLVFFIVFPYVSLV